MNTTEPVAWMVVNDDGQDAFVTSDPSLAVGPQRALPLYVSPVDVEALQKKCAELEKALSLEHRRYQWCANELLACDYGDNPKGIVGYRVYGWRDRTGERIIYGSSINEAVDAELP